MRAIEKSPGRDRKSEYKTIYFSLGKDCLLGAIGCFLCCECCEGCCECIADIICKSQSDVNAMSALTTASFRLPLRSMLLDSLSTDMVLKDSMVYIVYMYIPFTFGVRISHLPSTCVTSLHPIFYVRRLPSHRCLEV